MGVRMTTDANLTTMNISLPAGLRAFIAKQVRIGGYTSASEYLRQLVRVAQQSVQIEARLLRAIEQGKPIPMDDRMWRDMDGRVAEIIRKQARKKA